MTSPSSRLRAIPQRLRTVMRVIDGAIEASTAVNNGRRPAAASLAALGIEAGAFDRIVRR